MKRRDFIWSVVAAGACTALKPGSPATTLPSGTLNLDTGWRFMRADVAGAESPSMTDEAWDRVDLPHTAHVEALVTGAPGTPTYQWQGICWYRRRLPPTSELTGKKVFLKFDAAMNVADVWLDGAHIGRHLGGYTPFVIDITDRIRPDSGPLVAVRLDNRDNAVTGPKPLEVLDFNMYGGLYRDVHLIVKNGLHITDAIFADRPASGGLFVTYPEVTKEQAAVRVQTHIRNDHRDARTFQVNTSLIGIDGKTIVSERSAPVTLQSGTDTTVALNLDVKAPRLWSPRDPNLYFVRSTITSGSEIVDSEETRVGIRHIDISRDGFRINGEKMFLRGTNRHQEYPYVGYAVPAAAQYRDAKRIKDAGFDYIRLSHYPQSPAFMDACDELGIVLMDSIPGWQYFGKDPEFAELQYRNCRDLIRRDRNHPSVIMWEVSLNETGMPKEFIAKTHAIAHEEYPGNQCYTCGWTYGYDVFIQARQHGGCTKETDHPCVVSEYGDWEYYAMTAGLNQQAWEGLTPAESNSRQLRWHGEKAMLQQSTNFQEAHNDNLNTRAFADGLWVMYDYNRGYAPDIESSGCADIFRLPKYSYHFFRSQRPPNEAPGANVFIASEWTPSSSTDVRVFSNCDEVELRLNGNVVERRRPDRNRMTTKLAHPPFTFAVGRFVPGTLEASGYIGGRQVASFTVETPGAIERVALSFDFTGRPPAGREKDVFFCHASLKDDRGTIVPNAWENVAFGATGDLTLIGANPFSSDAGIASIVVETKPRSASGEVFGLSIIRSETGARILGASLPLIARATPFQIRYTTDGSTPSSESRLYTDSISGSNRIRAAIVLGGQIIAALDEGTPKFRIQGSEAPKTRDPFRRESD